MIHWYLEFQFTDTAPFEAALRTLALAQTNGRASASDGQFSPVAR
jgi:hypothetical protein